MIITNYNPITYYFCRECPHYKPTGNYIYELERYGKEGQQNRKCKNLKICRRIGKIVKDNQVFQLKFKGDMI